MVSIHADIFSAARIKLVSAPKTQSKNRLSAPTSPSVSPHRCICFVDSKELIL